MGTQILFPEMRILAYYRSDYFLAALAKIGTGLIADFKFLAGSSFPFAIYDIDTKLTEKCTKRFYI